MLKYSSILLRISEVNFACDWQAVNFLVGHYCADSDSSTRWLALIPHTAATLQCIILLCSCRWHIPSVLTAAWNGWHVLLLHSKANWTSIMSRIISSNSWVSVSICLKEYWFLNTLTVVVFEYYCPFDCSDYRLNNSCVLWVFNQYHIMYVHFNHSSCLIHDLFTVEKVMHTKKNN